MQAQNCCTMSACSFLETRCTRVSERIDCADYLLTILLFLQSHLRWGGEGGFDKVIVFVLTKTAYTSCSPVLDEHGERNR